MLRWLTGAMIAIAYGFFDRGEGIPEDRLRWMIGDVDHFLMKAGWKTRSLFIIDMTAIELLPPLMIGRLCRFSRLKPKDRAKYLKKMDESRFCILLALPKAIQGLCYYEHPDALAETGYDGTCLIGEMPSGVGLVQLPRRGDQ